MVITRFTEYFSENPARFAELIHQLESRGYATDESLKVSRCLVESVTQTKFDAVFSVHYPGKGHDLQIGSTAIARIPGEFVYVVYNTDIYENIAAIEKRLRHDGILDVDPDLYAPGVV